MKGSDLEKPLDLLRKDFKLIKLTNWLTENKGVLSFNSIEVKGRIPQGTLSKVVKGTRPLPKKWIPVLTALQKQMCGGEK